MRESLDSNESPYKATHVCPNMANHRILVIDTETTGLPPRGMPYDQLEAWAKCRMVQIAWHLYEADGSLVNKEVYIIQPDGWTVPMEAQNIHGISTRMAIASGVPIDHVFQRLQDILPNVSTVVAHNTAFDKMVVLAELFRYNQESMYNLFSSMHFHCTMKHGTIPGQKWPKLTDLYTRIFGEAPKGTLHQADTDVEACAMIYWHTQNTQ